jgi:alpha-1,2-glucosyltransferase
MFGSPQRTLTSALVMGFMAYTVKNFTIHHPFLLSDNRHYTFYVWKRVFSAHPAVPYLLILAYLASAWAWFLRVGKLFGWLAIEQRLT